jgi:hypothetical protein
MHFPGGVDLKASGADILMPPDPDHPQTKPFVGLRTHAGRSLLPHSPTVLIHAGTGQRILHFVELDARAEGNPERQALIIRPAVNLTPGERYIVAVRGLVDLDGQPIQPEPPFRALRDRQATDIAAIENRRQYFETHVFAPLVNAPMSVPRQDLQLAFDYRVQSDAGLTSQVIAMLQQTYAWLEDQIGVQHHQTFTVNPFGTGKTDSNENDCNGPGTTTWRILRGTYQVPLFLTEDPAHISSLGVLNVDANGVPIQNGVTRAPFTLSIPCAAKRRGAPAPHTILLGHGLFGSGDDVVTAFDDVGLDYVAGATDWRGLSRPDSLWVALAVVGVGTSQLNNFPAFVDRLKQGLLNTLLLARMMKRGDFNLDPAFQVAPGVGAVPVGTDAFYFGSSLGGIMGTLVAALTPDIERFNIDVPAMNFSLLTQRSTQFTAFESLFQSIGLTDPMETLVLLSLQHELWVRAEPAGYIHLLTPQVAQNAKKMLMTVVWLDKQVSNQASEILARALGIGNHEGSVLQDIVGIPEVSGPQDSAMVIYDTGAFDLFFAPHEPFIPELANTIAHPRCDPHGERLTIPVSVMQAIDFLQPDGRIINFCNGVCDAAEPDEQPGGGPVCDPLMP